MRAAFAAIGVQHTAAHFVRAVLEGVAYSLEDTFALFLELGIPVTAIRLGGGGARSPIWRQIQADAYAKPVSLLAAEEGCAYGAAVLAGVGAGLWPSVDEACAEIVRIASVVSPVKQSSDKLQQQYKIYRAIYPALKQIKAAVSAG